MKFVTGLTLFLSSFGLLLGGPAFGQDAATEDAPDVVAPAPAGDEAAPADVADGGECCGDACGCDAGCGCDDGCGWCNLGDPWTLKGALCDECDDDRGIDYGGWLQFGYHNKSTGVFNTHPDHLDLQQAWIYAVKAAETDECKSWDWGFGIDFLYGTDAQNTQAFGNPPGSWDYLNGWDHGVYGYALPQLYGEVAYENLTVKGGHFFTPAGYEVVAATGNFFYSHAFTHNFSEPFTHTGVLASYAATDNLTGHAGWTSGWDTGFDSFNDSSTLLAGATYSVADSMTATYFLTVGNQGFIGEGNTHHFVFDWVVSDKWEYVLVSDIVHTNMSVFTGTGYDTISLCNYLFYTVNDCMKAGSRLEWWKADGISYYETTYGLNIIPHANVRIRPELRYQWSPAGDGPAGNPVGLPLKGAMFGVDFIVTF